MKQSKRNIHFEADTAKPIAPRSDLQKATSQTHWACNFTISDAPFMLDSLTLSEESKKLILLRRKLNSSLRRSLIEDLARTKEAILDKRKKEIDVSK